MLVMLIIVVVLFVLLLIDRQKVAKELDNRCHQVQRLKGELSLSEGNRRYFEERYKICVEEHLEIKSAAYSNESYNFHELREKIIEILKRRFDEVHAVDLEFKD